MTSLSRVFTVFFSETHICLYCGKTEDEKEERCVKCARMACGLYCHLSCLAKRKQNLLELIEAYIDDVNGEYK